MLITPGGTELIGLAVVLVLLVVSLLILCFATRIGLGMSRETWRALFWTSGLLTGLSFLANILSIEGLRALLSVPFLFVIWTLALLPVFSFGRWLRGRRQRQRAADGTPEPGDEDGPQDG